MEKYPETLLGQLLISGGFVSAEDIQRILTIQKEKNKKIGELLTDEGLIDPAELNIALEIQNKLRNPSSALKLSAGIKKRLGEILLDARKISSEQLEEALKIQEKTGEKLGQILLKLGYIKSSELKLALLFQEFSDKPIPNNLKIGEILCKVKIINKDQLKKALEIQKVFPEKKIGQILIELGYLDREGLEKGLRIQQKLILATLSGLFALTNFFNLDILNASDKIKPNTSASAKVFVSAHLKAYAKIKVLEQKSFITITDEDINRGYKYLQSFIIFEIKANTPNVYLTIQNYNNEFFDNAKILLNGNDIELGNGGSIIFLKGLNRVFSSDMDLNLKLKKGLKPGNYQISLVLSVEGI